MIHVNPSYNLGPERRSASMRSLILPGLMMIADGPVARGMPRTVTARNGARFRHSRLDFFEKRKRDAVHLLPGLT